jgi:UDP-N-acetylmuramoylalanine--D-glutamate ligase
VSRAEFAEPGGTALPGRGTAVLVLGLGMSGEAAVRHLVGLGADVTAVDEADDAALRERAGDLEGARVVLGDAAAGPDTAATVDLVVASPGVPEHAPSLEAARGAGVPVWSEIELAFRLANAPILGITGTNGKTTTTGMLAASLAEAGVRAAAAGNIGFPLVDAAVEGHEVIVAELSSFQLRHVVSFRTPVGVLLNVADDHLDWHGTFEAYVAAKARLFERQTTEDFAIHHADDESARAAGGSGGTLVPFTVGAPSAGGAGVRDGKIVVPQGDVIFTAALRARGVPALANAVAAAAAAAAFGAPLEPIARALAEFKPLPHRMELVAQIGGVSYVNDSKATNPHAVLAALDGSERVVLIAGGRNKGLDLSTLTAAAGSLRAVVAIGAAGPEIADAFTGAGVPAERAGSMDEAVARAAAIATSGDTVLLSPGCASFDMFADYKARGESFRAAVKRLSAGNASGGGNA